MSASVPQSEMGSSNRISRPIFEKPDQISEAFFDSRGSQEMVALDKSCLFEHGDPKTGISQKRGPRYTPGVKKLSNGIVKGR